MNKQDAKEIARKQLADLLELDSVMVPRYAEFSKREPGDECYWFSFRFPKQCWIGAGWVIGIRKSNGSVAYFGMDGSE